MNSVVKLEVNWSEYKPNCGHPAQELLDKIHNKLQELKAEKNSEVDAHLSAESCSYVYWGCGSCSGDQARVDAYCGSGGSTPDFSWCEPC